MTRRVEYVLCTVLFVFAFVFYSSTFSSPLFFNQIVHDYSAGIPTEKMGGARWIFYIFNYLTFSKSGLSVEIFRIQNFVVHLASAFVFFCLFKMLFDLMPLDSWLYRFRQKIVLTATGLFLLHPVQTQTVLNVEHMRLEGLMVMMMLLTLYCFLRVLRDAHNDRLWYKNGWMYFALCFAVSAVGTKEACIVLPLLAVVLDWFFIAAGSLARLFSRVWAHVVLFATFFVAFFSVNGHLALFDMVSGCCQVISAPGCLLTASYDQALSASLYALAQIPVLLHYVWIFFYPFDLHFDYDVAIPTNVLHPVVFISLLCLLALVMVSLALWVYNKRNLISFGFCWFFIALLPRVAFCAPSTELVGDYKTFLGSIGMMVMLAGIAWYVIDWLCSNVLHIESKLGWSVVSIAGCWGVVTLLGTTKMHVDLCQNPVVFWQREVAHTPQHARNFYYLANALQAQQETQAAVDAYQRAVVLDEAYADPLIALGEIYHDQGDVHRALSFYLKAEKKKYSVALASRLFLNEGKAYLALQDLDASEDALKKSLQLKPVSVDAYFQYAQLLKKKARFDEAYVHVDRFLRYVWQNDSHDAVVLKARMAFELGQHREVVQLLENNIKESDDVSVSFVLAAAHYSVENYKRSADLFEKVYQRCPDNLDVAYNCAQALMRADKFAQAIAYFKQCNDVSKYPFAPVHTAACLLKNGNVASGQYMVADLQQQDLQMPVKLQLAQLQQDFHIA